MQVFLGKEAEEAKRLARMKTFNVAVRRKKSIQECRMKLPVCGVEQEIMELVRNNDIVVLCGATGCGKTAQVPQFLYEAGYGCKAPGNPNPGMVAVTQPRRVAAVSVARRVADELDCPYGLQRRGDAAAADVVRAPALRDPQVPGVDEAVPEGARQHVDVHAV